MKNFVVVLLLVYVAAFLVLAVTCYHINKRINKRIRKEEPVIWPVAKGLLVGSVTILLISVGLIALLMEIEKSKSGISLFIDTISTFGLLMITPSNLLFLSGTALTVYRCKQASQQNSN